jgi:hypothetical protein
LCSIRYRFNGTDGTVGKEVARKVSENNFAVDRVFQGSLAAERQIMPMRDV